MHIKIDLSIHNISFDQDIHSVLAHLKLILEERLTTQVDLEVDDYDFTDKLTLSKKLNNE